LCIVKIFCVYNMPKRPKIRFRYAFSILYVKRIKIIKIRQQEEK